MFLDLLSQLYKLKVFKLSRVTTKYMKYNSSSNKRIKGIEKWTNMKFQ